MLERLGPAVGLSVSDFGAWAQGSGASGPVVPNFYAAGQNPTTSLPSTGQATYNGQYIGHLGSGNVSGGIGLTADFGAMNISSQFTSGQLSTALGGVASGTINSNGSYNTSFTAAPPDFGHGYQLTGQFYGSNAAETTGSFSGTAGSSGASVSGVFGAKR